MRSGRLGFFCGALDVELAELLEIGFGGGVGHHFHAAVVFREGDHIADAVFAGDQHHEAVEAQGNASVGRGAELEGFENMAEEELLLFGVHAEDAEHF